jgi:uncharacterized membrane protein
MNTEHIMRFNAVEIAAWIIIWYAIYRFASGWLDDGHNRRKKLAAKLEYEDSATSEERRHNLLACYAETIVEVPAHEFMLAAREQIKREKKNIRKLDVFLGIFSVAATVIVGLIVILVRSLLH